MRRARPRDHAVLQVKTGKRMAREDSRASIATGWSHQLRWVFPLVSKGRTSVEGASKGRPSIVSGLSVVEEKKLMCGDFVYLYWAILPMTLLALLSHPVLTIETAADFPRASSGLEVDFMLSVKQMSDHLAQKY